MVEYFSRQQLLDAINSEPILQSRLNLLVKNNLIAEAKSLVRRLVREFSTILLYGANPTPYQPLLRVTTDGLPIYVSVGDGQKNHLIIFELGWERRFLGWSEEDTRDLLRSILAQALARPINQWSLIQVEGMARAARQLLNREERLAREIAAWHLVYHLRGADFGNIRGYLADISGFPPVSDGDETGTVNLAQVVNWIVDRLIEFGWSFDRIRKEFAEWIHLKTTTWPEWLLAVARAKCFAGDDPVIAEAVRSWIIRGFDNLLGLISDQSKIRAAENVDTFRELLRIGRFGIDDAEWVIEKLTRYLASGKASPVANFVKAFGSTFGFATIDFGPAIAIAIAEGNFGTAVTLTRVKGQEPDQWLLDIVRVRSLSLRLE